MTNKYVTEVSRGTFERDVLEASAEVPILVDFWAPWCGPCRTLGPLLENLAAEYDGAFRLAKVNTEEEQELAGAFGIQSIPHCFLIKEGAPVDQFQGALGEAQIREFLSQHITSSGSETAAELERQILENPAAAEQDLRAAIAEDPNSRSLKMLLIKALAGQQRWEAALSEMTAVEQDAPLDADERALKSLLQTNLESEAGGGFDAIAARAAEEPENVEAQTAHIEALAGRGEIGTACSVGLDLFTKFTGEERDAIKSSLVKVFEMAGPENEEARLARRRLAALMY